MHFIVLVGCFLHLLIEEAEDGLRVLGKLGILHLFFELGFQSRVLRQKLASLFFHVRQANPELVGGLHHLVEEAPINQ